MLVIMAWGGQKGNPEKKNKTNIGLNICTHGNCLNLCLFVGHFHITLCHREKRITTRAFSAYMIILIDLYLVRKSYKAFCISLYTNLHPSTGRGPSICCGHMCVYTATDLFCFFSKQKIYFLHKFRITEKGFPIAYFKANQRYSYDFLRMMSNPQGQFFSNICRLIEFSFLSFRFSFYRLYLQMPVI